MTRHETVRPRPATVGQLRDIATTLGQACPDEMPFEDAEWYTGHKGILIATVRKTMAALCPPARIRQLRVDWESFYSEYFDLTVDFSALAIPEQPDDFERLIIVAQGITAQRVYDVCKQHFPCWKYTDRSLDEAVPTNERDAKNAAYAVWNRERVEADEELKNLSAEDIGERELKSDTLTERLLYGLKFYAECRQHLDIENVTLCTGSRDSDGRVPDVDWYGDELSVCWYYPGNAYGYLRAREVVS